MRRGTMIRRALLGGVALLLVVAATVSAALIALLGADLTCGIGGSETALAAGPLAGPEPDRTALREIPADFLRLYREAGTALDISWPFLASIGYQECGHGTGDCYVVNPSGCAGPMEMAYVRGSACSPSPSAPTIWERFQTDGDGDGKTSIFDNADSIFTAAKLLRRSAGAPPAGGPYAGYRRAACNYYGACGDGVADYADEVMERAIGYGFVSGAGGVPSWPSSEMAAEATGSRAPGGGPRCEGSSVLPSGSGPMGPVHKDFAPRHLAPLPMPPASAPGMQCDARIVDDVVYLARRFGLLVTACYEIHSLEGEHPLGAAIDAVPRDGDWDRTMKAALAIGWKPSCAASGVAPECARPPFRFIGYNGYPEHGDPPTARHVAAAPTSISPGTPRRRSASPKTSRGRATGRRPGSRSSRSAAVPKAQGRNRTAASGPAVLATANPIAGTAEAPVAERAIIDLFAGAGGWEEGLRELGLSAIGIENDALACAAGRAAGHGRLEADIAALDPDGFDPLWGLIASPPCQAYSIAGKKLGRADEAEVIACARELAAGHDTRAGRLAACGDKRSLLTVEPLRWALTLRPRWIALEQVPAVLGLWELFAELLESHGYRSATGCLSAERYGVPQVRKRAFLVASLDGEVRLPEPSHRSFHPRRHSVPAEELELPNWISMAEALGWGSEPATLRSNHTSSGRIPGGAPRSLDRPSFTLIGSSYTWRIERGPAEEVRPRPGWTRRRPATTVLSEPRVFGPGCWPRNGHPPGRVRRETIRVSVEQASILQGFCHDYPWQGARTARFRQIGNAVCPPVARVVLAEAMRPSSKQIAGADLADPDARSDREPDAGARS